MAVNRELDRFLESVERRAFVKARLATGQEQEALDIVQDAMFKLVKSYGDKQSNEWGPLFQRILQSRITDWYRRQAVKNRLFPWLSKSAENDAYEDQISGAIDKQQAEPWEHLNGKQLSGVLEKALQSLPLRQQQAFILRQWDGLSVSETAQAMDCSQSSVKTHSSRALTSLKQTLQTLGIDAQNVD